MWMSTVLWISAGVILFTYAGYPLLLWLMSFFKKKNGNKSLQGLPYVSIIIAAFNEEQVLEKKLQNSFALRYPKELLQVIVVADGSTDRTVQIASSFKAVLMLHEADRKGKAAAINRAVSFAQNEIIVFTDANSFMQPDTLQELVAPFADKETGAVAGEKKIADAESIIASGEGMYWKYESWLKQKEADFYTVVGAAGELFALRKELVVTIPENAITDDFFLSLSVNLQQKKCAYAKKAVSTEAASLSLTDEWNRKVRIASGGMQSLVLVSAALNLFKHPRVAFQFFCHRVLRWLFCAPAFIILLFTNYLLVMNGASYFYSLLLLLQVLFYVFAVTGWMMAVNRKTIFLFSTPFYILFMHAAMLAGAWQFVTGKQSVLWQKAKR